jgi:hypothetical protein
MNEVYQKLIDRTRAPLDLKQVKTIFGFSHRPHHTAKRGRQAVQVVNGSVTLGYRLGQGQPIEQPVYFSWTRPQFGGRRPWFLCPLCIRRVALLYLRGERWSCRKCCNLAYRSELELKGYRDGHRRIQEQGKNRPNGAVRRHCIHKNIT